MYKIEQGINQLEHTLSMCAARTVIFPIFGCIKSQLGVIQLTVAVVSLFFSMPYMEATGDMKPCRKSIEHIKHGVGNIVAGFFESIPVIQTLVHLEYLKWGVEFRDAQKIMPYQDLTV